jgi:hypothetical protein
MSLNYTRDAKRALSAFINACRLDNREVAEKHEKELYVIIDQLKEFLPAPEKKARAPKKAPVIKEEAPEVEAPEAE